MQPADDIKKLIDEAQITSSSQVDRRILADALEDLEKRRAERAERPRPVIWRIVMRSKTAKIAAAAAIVVAVLLGFHFLGSPLLHPRPLLIVAFRRKSIVNEAG